MTERDKVTVDNIIGLVHTDEITNSVSEVRKLRGRKNERFILVEYVNKGLFIQDNANDETQYFQGSKASLEKVVDLLNSLTDENEQLRKDCTVLIYHNQEYRKENEQLKSENQRLTDKLNNTALEFLNHDMVTMGKATEISEMCYSDFLKFRKENGNPMELQEMTENNRFEISGEGSTNIDVTTYIVEYGDGDDDCFELYESKEHSQKVCDKLNNILNENEQLKADKQALIDFIKKEFPKSHKHILEGFE